VSQKMANRKNISKISINSEILCKVQHALEDLIVVTFSGPNNKVFQGVLLDSTKRNIPFGVCPPGGFQKRLNEDNPRDYAVNNFGEPDPSDTFPTVSRRQTYFQDGKVEKPPLLVPTGKRAKAFMSQEKKLGVRLRARQVLCSKCSSVCNEKGENVRENARREKEARNGATQQNKPVKAETPKGVPERSQRVIKPKILAKLSNVRVNKKEEATNSPSMDCSSSSDLITASKAVKNNKCNNRVNLSGVRKRKPKILPRKLKKNLDAVKSSDSFDTSETTSDQSETFSTHDDISKTKPRKGKSILPPSTSMDSNQYEERTKKLAKKNSLVPKLRRLAPSEIERFSDVSNSDRESCSDNERCSSANNSGDRHVTSSKVSSSTETKDFGRSISLPSCSDNNMQPLKIRFSNLTKQTSKNSTGRQYSIVKSEENNVFSNNYDGTDSDQQKENIDDYDSESDTEGVKRKSNGVNFADNMWDDNLSEENQPLKKVFKKEDSEREKPAPVLKISFGKESTVLKLPSKPGTSQYSDFVEPEMEKDPLKPAGFKSFSNCKDKPDSAGSKAAKKALKRAKKEAQRKAMGMVSPARTYLGSKSPHNMANFSPGQSPAHRATLPSPARSFVGGISPGRHFSGVSPVSPARFNSPAHPIGSASPAYTLLCPGSQKLIIRKIKKKKHKKDKEKVKEDAENEAATSSKDAKVLIHFKSSPEIQPDLEEEDQSISPRRTSSDEFQTEHVHILEKPGISVESALLSDGHTMCVGDVVWGKAEGNPWWPGKVLNLMMIDEGTDRDDMRAHAQLSWYTSSTTTTIPCTEVKPFLECYEEQINKRKRGNYREAVKLATEDARQASSIPLAGLSPSPSASPREILV